MPFCYSDNGFSMIAVRGDYAAKEGEVVFTNYATEKELAAAFPNYAAIKQQNAIKAQITALESTQTPRRLREAIVGTDGGWLANLESEIAVLRGQLGKTDG